MSDTQSKVHPATIFGAAVAALCIHEVAYGVIENHRLAFNNAVHEAATILLQRNIQVGIPLTTVDGRAIGYVSGVKDKMIIAPLHTDIMPLPQKLGLWMNALWCETQGRASGYNAVLYLHRETGWRNVEVRQTCAPLRYPISKTFINAPVQP